MFAGESILMQCSSQDLGSIWWHIGWPQQLMKYVMPKTNVSSHSKPFRCVIITGWGSISQDMLNVNDVKEQQQNNSFVKPAHLNTSRALIDISDDICASNVRIMTATIADVARMCVSWIKIYITLNFDWMFLLLYSLSLPCNNSWVCVYDQPIWSMTHRADKLPETTTLWTPSAALHGCWGSVRHAERGILSIDGACMSFSAAAWMFSNSRPLMRMTHP